MRFFWYLVVFITPTILVLVFHRDIIELLEDKGILRKKSVPSEKATGSRDSSTGPAIPEGLPPAIEAKAREIKKTIETMPKPQIKALEEIVGHWKNVPKAAFPEMVVLDDEVKVEIKRDGKVIGKSSYRKGMQVYPIELNGEILKVSASRDGQGAIGGIHVDKTNFKEQIQQKYENWKERQLNLYAKRQKEETRRLETIGEEGEDSSASVADAVGNPGGEDSGDPSAASPGKQPERAPDGSIPIMVESIKAGEVPEIQLDRISGWRWIGQEEFGGTTYWAGAVSYVAETIFGEIQAEGKALMRDGKVVKWLYSGSEEEIR